MPSVKSKDGTAIVYELIGSGTPLIIVDGALCYRAFGPSRGIAEQLADRFQVVIYDRRGRGESGNAPHYTLQQEIDDLAALIQAVGGSADVVGFSSGAVLAAEAARQLPGIRKLAVYEPPLIVDDTRRPITDSFIQQLGSAAASRPGDAVRMFMKFVDTPAFLVIMMRFMPVWSKLKAVGHTLPYDISIVSDYQRGKPLPRQHWAALKAPTVAVDGGKSPTWMRNGVKSLADSLPNAHYRTLEGQTHMVKAEVIAPVLKEFFLA